MKRYWPFDSGIFPENHYQEFVDFFKDAYKKGYSPYIFGNLNFGVSTQNLFGEIVHRGRNQLWEPYFGKTECESEQKLSNFVPSWENKSVFVRDFDTAKNLVFDWIEKQSFEKRLLDLLRSSSKQEGRNLLILNPKAQKGEKTS